MAQMTEHSVLHVPVVNGGRLVGIISIGAEGRYRDIFGQGFPVKDDLGGDIYAKIQLQGR